MIVLCVFLTIMCLLVCVCALARMRGGGGWGKEERSQAGIDRSSKRGSEDNVQPSTVIFHHMVPRGF